MVRETFKPPSVASNASATATILTALSRVASAVRRRPRPKKKHRQRSSNVPSPTDSYAAASIDAAPSAWVPIPYHPNRTEAPSTHSTDDTPASRAETFGRATDVPLVTVVIEDTDDPSPRDEEVLHPSSPDTEVSIPASSPPRTFGRKHLNASVITIQSADKIQAPIAEDVQTVRDQLYATEQQLDRARGELAHSLAVARQLTAYNEALLGENKGLHETNIRLRGEIAEVGEANALLRKDLDELLARSTRSIPSEGEVIAGRESPSPMPR